MLYFYNNVVGRTVDVAVFLAIPTYPWYNYTMESMKKGFLI